MSERYALLLAYLDSLSETIERHDREIQSRLDGTRNESDERTIVLGYALHNRYCALEDVFEQVARTFENSIEDPGRFHSELLKRMKMVIPGVRPALINTDVYAVLNELRAFRHVFRHAYDYQLDPEKVRRLGEKVLANRGELMADIDRFRRFLQERIEGK